MKYLLLRQCTTADIITVTATTIVVIIGPTIMVIVLITIDPTITVMVLITIGHFFHSSGSDGEA
jgi:hypothetical protein